MCYRSHLAIIVEAVLKIAISDCIELIFGSARKGIDEPLILCELRPKDMGHGDAGGKLLFEDINRCQEFARFPFTCTTRN
jgi:hypothetical protein